MGLKEFMDSIEERLVQEALARAAGVNGERSMILDTARTDPPGWEHDRPPVIPAAKRSVGPAPAPRATSTHPAAHPSASCAVL